jgi:16S rRNA pseudouridine516 synthase
VKAIRLDRLLGNLGYGSRRDIALMVRAGRIALSDQTIAAADTKIPLDQASGLTIGGKPIDPLPGLVLMVNKPIGLTCSHKEAGPLVFDLLPDRWRRRTPPLSTVGRLDKDTSGLLLMTDDGALLHRIIAPAAHISKRYRATLARPLRGDEAAIFQSGTLLLNGEDKPLRPARLAVVAEQEALVTIDEGRYHQVRRMFAAVGNHVETLHREAIGALELPADLGEGDFRILSEDEIAAVFSS